MDIINGKRTYISAGIGIVVAIAGYAFGPIDLGVVIIPQIGINDAAKLIWAGIMVIFMRAGIKNGN